MSANVSLANVGTSLNFDGQALQNQEEAEIEREEQIQQNELKQLLSSAFDELDDDILSVGSSEDDSVNSSHISSHQDSFHDLPATSASLAAKLVGNSTSLVQTKSTGTTKPFSGQRTYAMQGHQTPPWSAQELGSGLSFTFVPKDSARVWDKQEACWGRDDGDIASEQNSSGSTRNENGSKQNGVHVHSGASQVEGAGMPEIDSVDQGQLVSGQDSHQSHDVQHGQEGPFYPSNFNSRPLTSQPTPLPVYYDSQAADPGSAQYWSNNVYSNVNPDSQILANVHQSHAHPGGNNRTAYQMENQPRFYTEGFDADGCEGALSDQMYMRFAHGWSASQDEEPFATDYHGYSVAPQSNGVPRTPASAVSSDSITTSHPDTVHFGLTRSAGNFDSNYHTVNAGTAYSGYPAAQSTVLQVRGRGKQDSDPTGNWTGLGDLGSGGSVEGQVFEGRTDGREEAKSFDHYTVKYRKLQHDVHPVTSKASELKVNFINQEGDNEKSVQLSQLQTLYRSRGRQMEELKQELESLTQDSAKERRKLKHLLTVATGEKEGVEVSLKQCQKLLQEVREEQTQTAGHLHSSQAQIKALTDTKEQLNRKLQSAETAIENLTHQVAALQTTDSLAQARRQHEAVVSSMQQRFDSQLLDLKQQLDRTNASITEKTEEITRLQAQVRHQSRLTEEAQVSRGETINQLTRSLEESQQRCQALLEASSSGESSKLRTQLQQLLLSKKMSDDLCNTLQTEVREVKEQLSLLETATSLGALTSTPQPSTFDDDSFTDLCIRKTLDFSKPDSSNSQSQDLVLRLRRELERCVISNRQKRSQVGELQQQVKQLRQEMGQLQQQLSDVQQTNQAQQVKLTSYEERLGGSLQPSVVECRLKRDIENLHLEKQAVLADIAEYKTRLNELSASEEHLTDINQKLKQQISALVSQHDQDKHQAIVRCRQTCDDVHKAAREKLEHQIRSELFADKQEVIMKYEEQLTTARQKLLNVEEELDKVKEMYVQTSEDLRQQELVQQNRDKDLAAEKERWKSEHDETEWQQHLAKEQSRWESEKVAEIEKEWQHRLDTECQRLLSEKQADLDKEWQHRLETECQRLLSEKQADLDKEWQHRLETECQRLLSEKQADLDKEWQQRLEAEHARWELQRQAVEDKAWQERLETERQHWETKMQEKLENERKSWELAKQPAMEAEWEDRLAKEHHSWKIAADREAQDKMDVAVKQARCRWQQEAVEQLKLVTTQLEECRLQHKEEIAALEYKWRQQLADKEAEVEQKVQQAVETEVKVQLTQQKSRLLEQAQQTLQQELSLLKKAHAKELQEERERALTEVKRTAEKDRTQLLWQKQAQAADLSNKEVTKWKEEAIRLQGEIIRLKETQHSEELRLLADKDEERRQAVASVRAECQADYQRFMDESKATLDSALESAREHHHQELAELEARYKKEFAEMRTLEQKLQRVSAEGSPPQDLGVSHDVSRIVRRVEKLKKEVEKRDKLLQQADSHMEQEVQRLKDSLADSYTKQREKDALHLEAKYSQSLSISQKECSRLERKVEQLLEHLTHEKAHQTDPYQLAENERLLAQLHKTVEERDSLQMEIEAARKQREKQQQNKDQLECQLQDCQRTLQTLADDKEVLLQQHSKQVAGLHERCNQSRLRLQKMEAALKAVNQQHKLDVERLQETLQTAQKKHLAAFNAEIAQVQKKHAEAVELLLEKHKLEKIALAEELEKEHQADMDNMIEELRQQTHRALANTPTQTVVEESLCSLKKQYFNIVQKIKEEVMQYISHCNERAASTMKAEIRLERQRLIHHLRCRCKSRLHQILQTTVEWSQGKTVWTLTEQALDSLFDSVSSSCSATPDTSAVITPRSSEEDAEHDTNGIEREEHDACSNSSALVSTPRSGGSEHYALPSVLARLELGPSQHGSLSDLQGSGVFYSLVPDDTASVTDSEQEFKAPTIVNKMSIKHVGFYPATPNAGLKTRCCTPPKISTSLSVFANKEFKKADISTLLSPKPHRKKSVDNEAAEVGGGDRGDVSGWKEVDGEGWTAAVGGTNLWQAYTDLKAMELADREPRRQLCFLSQSLVDCSAEQGGKLEPHSKSDKSQVKFSHKQAIRPLSKSVDFTLSKKALSVSHPNRSIESLSAEQLPERSQSQRQLSIPQSAYQDAYSSCSVPSKLSAKDFLSQSLTRSAARGEQGEAAGETLDFIMERLGLSKRHDIHPHSSAAVSKDLNRKSESVVSAESNKQKLPSNIPKAKNRAHSADDDVSKHIPTSRRSRSTNDNMSHSVIYPQQSAQIPVFASTQWKQQGRHKDLAVQRSLEELHQTAPLSLSSRGKSRSEQALHMLSNALSGGEGEYRYAPLKQFLPDPSPSTSLLSTYSVSEGDLRHLQHHLAWDWQQF